jgi:predicted nucleotidyltransferase
MKQVIYLKNDMLRAYAVSFVSYFISKIGEKLSYIDRITLYGSVAKGEATKESDVDIFIDTEKRRQIEQTVKKIVNKFPESKEALWFKAKGIQNEINVKIGKLSEWKEIHRSVASTGINLWSWIEVKENPVGSKHKIIFFWDEIGKNRGAFLNKLYGFNANGKRYAGLLERWGGYRTGKSCVVIPIKYKNDMLEFLKKYAVNAKNIEIFSFE